MGCARVSKMEKGRVCLKCNQYKESNCFGKSKLYKDGLRSWCNECRKKDRQENPFKYKMVNKNYYIKNKIKIGKYNHQYHLKKYKNDPLYNLQIKLRKRIWMALKKRRLSKKGSDTTIKLLGCSYQEFKQYIESKFIENMSWEKVLSGEIHIDHIKPVSSFNLFDEQQLKQCFHYTNLQPLWGTDNLSKSCKIIFVKEIRG